METATKPEKKPKRIPSFLYHECMACTDCVISCPFSCLIADKIDIDSYKKPYPRLKTDHDCNGCAICAKDCPVDAIIMTDRDSAVVDN